jgi:hypothetical protein
MLADWKREKSRPRFLLKSQISAISKPCGAAGKNQSGRVDNIFSSLSTVVSSHLQDRNLFGFVDPKTDGVAIPWEIARLTKIRARPQRRTQFR